jgi:hypothetical protein
MVDSADSSQLGEGGSDARDRETDHRRKPVSGEEAVSHIESRNRLFVNHQREPRALALASRKDGLSTVGVTVPILIGPLPGMIGAGSSPLTSLLVLACQSFGSQCQTKDGLGPKSPEIVTVCSGSCERQVLLFIKIGSVARPWRNRIDALRGEA